MMVIGRAVMIASVISLVSMPARETRAQPACEPAVRASGDATLVSEVNDALTAGGVSIQAAIGCSEVNVAVERRGDAIHLTITDAYGRSTERLVRDVSTAATVVESWTMQEVEALATTDLAGIDAAVAAPLQLRDEAPAVAPSAVAPFPRAAVGGAFVLLAGSDGHERLGGVVGACVRLGRACLGAEIALATQTRVSDHAGGRDRERWLDLQAVARLPLRLGPLIVAPTVGLGGAWLGTTTSFDPPHEAESLVHSAKGLHASAGLEISRSLTYRVVARGAISGFVGAWSESPMPGPNVFLTVTLGLAMVVP